MPTNDYILRVKATGVKATTGAVKGLTGAVRSFTRVIAPLLAVTAVFKGLKDSVTMAGDIVPIQRAFDNLTKSAGLSAQTLGKLRAATDGTVNSIDLMTQANNMLILGITNSEDEMADLFDTAQRLGEALGVDAATAVEKLTVGLGRQSILRLDDLGIVLDQITANTNYAKSIGKNVNALTEQDKKQAFVTEAMRQAKLALADIGDEQESFTRKVQRFMADVQNMGVVIGGYLMPIISDAIDFMYTIGEEFNKLKLKAAKVDWLLTLKNLVDNMPAFVETMGLIWADMIDYMIDLGKFLTEEYGDVFLHIIKKMVDFVKNIVHFFADPFVFAMVALTLEVKLLFQEMWSEIKGGASDAINWMIEKANYLLPKAMEIEWRAEAPDLSGIEETKASLEAIAIDIANLDFTKWLQGITDDDVKTAEDLLNKVNQHITQFVDGIVVLNETSKDEDGNNPVDAAIHGKGGGDPDKTKELTEFEKFALDEKLINYSVFIQQLGNINAAYNNMLASNNAAEINNLKKSKKYMDASEDDQATMLQNLEDKHFDTQKNMFYVSQGLRIGEIIMSTAEGVARALTMPVPNLVLAGMYKAFGAIQAGIVLATKAPVKPAQFGFSGLVDEPTTFLAGEKGAEYVNVTPLEGPNLAGGGAGGVTVNISGNVMSDEWVSGELSERIAEAVRRGVNFGF